MIKTVYEYKDHFNINKKSLEDIYIVHAARDSKLGVTSL